MATLIYDSKITNKDEILKRIALVGYDSENPCGRAAYSALPGCCQYDRAADVEEVKGNTVAKSQAAQTQQTKKKNN
jgi:hypothetical protein